MHAFEVIKGALLLRIPHDGWCLNMRLPIPDSARGRLRSFAGQVAKSMFSLTMAVHRVIGVIW